MRERDINDHWPVEISLLVVPHGSFVTIANERHDDSVIEKSGDAVWLLVKFCD
jgi:hypothetical protein